MLNGIRRIKMITIIDGKKLGKCFVDNMTEEQADKILKEYEDFPEFPAYYQALCLKKELEFNRSID